LSLTEDPTPRGHAFEFRINGEDPGRNFLPAPGKITRYIAPAGPGVRVDSGVVRNSIVSGAFDSLLAKLIVWGPTRADALARARRALGEYVIEGMPTALPFHRAVVSDPAFTSEPFRVFTQWIETEFDNQIPSFSGRSAGLPDDEHRETVVVEVSGKRLEVVLPAWFGAVGAGSAAVAGVARKAVPRRSSKKSPATAAASSGDALTAPMQGTLVKIAVEEGAEVEVGDLVVVLEAMKMEQAINAHKSGTISGLKVEVGAVVTSGSTICEIKD
jgi:acetyl-CoA/propionyl-CoA carboxylase biotin carboxyl carrier protein